MLPITSCPGLYSSFPWDMYSLVLWVYTNRQVDQTIPVVSQMYIPKLSMQLLPKPGGDQYLLLVKGGIWLQRHLHILKLRPLHAGVYMRAGVSSQQLMEMGYRIWWPEIPQVSSGR